jgi:hypothetical protein
MTIKNMGMLKHIEYLYDFGDYWEHSVKIVKEKKDERLLHPICIEGEGTCPPEDVGGIHGFEEFKEIMNDKDNQWKNRRR